MYLLIAPNAQKSTLLQLFSKAGTTTRLVEGRSKLFLKAIDDLLKQYQAEVTDLKGIAVVLEVGSFTATRVATTIANMLSYTHGIPLVGISQHDAKNSTPEKWFLHAQAGQLISARYSAQANIGK